MSATVNLAELPPDVQKKVLKQIEPIGVNRDALAQRIVDGIGTLSAKLRELEDDIRQLWVEFRKLKDGETILGCTTKKEFCERHLRRTPRAVQYLLAGQSNPADRPHKPSELSSPLLEEADVFSAENPDETSFGFGITSSKHGKKYGKTANGYDPYELKCSAPF